MAFHSHMWCPRHGVLSDEYRHIPSTAGCKTCDSTRDKGPSLAYFQIGNYSNFPEPVLCVGLVSKASPQFPKQTTILYSPKVSISDPFLHPIAMGSTEIAMEIGAKVLLVKSMALVN